MSSDAVPQTNPAREDFAGGSPGATAKRLFHATRPKFYPASILPVVVGTAWGFQAAGSFNLTVFLLALLATVCVHAGSNVVNDVGDESGGTDRQNDDRIYPYTGGSRFIQQNIMDARAMARLGTGLMITAALAGLLLFSLKGPLVLAFGVVGILLGVIYSVGPVRLAGSGLGETAVAVAFGVLPVTGAAWLQSGTLDSAVVLYSIPVSMWVAAILLINEVPDIRADGDNGKRTLPVRLGLKTTSVFYLSLHITAVAIIGWLTYSGHLPLLAAAIPIVMLSLAVRATFAIRNGIADRSAMTSAIEGTLAIHTIGCVWLSGCVLYLHWFGTQAT